MQLALAHKLTQIYTTFILILHALVDIILTYIQVFVYMFMRHIFVINIYYSETAGFCIGY